MSTDDSLSFGALTKADPRSYWPHEGTNFTPWLAANIGKLGEALGLDLELRQREAAVGQFSLDLLAHDLGQDRKVIIENQLETTDHDHLGKLLTYAAGYDAEVVIWISTEIRDEHRQALEWLNLHTDEKTEFFGVVLEVWRIDTSKPAVNLKAVVFPNDWQKNVRPRLGTVAPTERGGLYRDFFQGLLDDLRVQHRFTNARIGQPQSWYVFSSGTSGLAYGVSFGKGRASAYLYIDRWEQDRNKAIFDALNERKAHFESQFGEPLTWERLDSKRASRIAVYCEGSIDSDDGDLVRVHEWFVAKLLKFKEVFSPDIAAVVDAVESKKTGQV